jgi:hypothetical protein
MTATVQDQDKSVKLEELATKLKRNLGRPVTLGYGMLWLWIRGPVTPPTFAKADTVRVGGIKYSGKSSLLETFAMGLLEKSKVYNADGNWKITSNLWDIFSASDSEALAYLNEECQYRKLVVIIKDPSALVTGPDWLKTINYTDVHPEDIRADLSDEGGHIYVLPYNFFPDKATRFKALSVLTERFIKRENFQTVDGIIIRESSGYLSAVIVAEKGQGTNIAVARQKMIEFNNELVHHSYSLLIDLQRADAELVKSIREQSNYSFYTKLGSIEWPRNKNWVGGYISFDLIRNLPRGWAFCMTDSNGLALVRYNMPLWHFERRGESLLDKHGIHIKFVQPSTPIAGTISGEYIGRTIDLVTHKRIVAMREEGKSYEEIGTALDVKPSSAGYHYRIHVKGACGCTTNQASV